MKEVYSCIQFIKSSFHRFSWIFMLAARKKLILANTFVCLFAQSGAMLND